MEPHSSTLSARPKVRRKRRLAATALTLLALGGGLWWSTRPNIDPKLVGTWRSWPAYYDEDAKDWVTIEGSSPDVVTLYVNGTGTTDYGPVIDFHCWWVEGDELWYSTSSSTTRAILGAAYSRLTGHSLGISAHVWRQTIMSASNDRVVLDWTGSLDAHEGEPARLLIRNSVPDRQERE